MRQMGRGGSGGEMTRSMSLNGWEEGRLSDRAPGDGTCQICRAAASTAFLDASDVRAPRSPPTIGTVMSLARGLPGLACSSQQAHQC